MISELLQGLGVVVVGWGGAGFGGEVPVEGPFGFASGEGASVESAEFAAGLFVADDWVDVAANALGRLETAASEGVIVSGNWTSIQLRGGSVAAQNDYGDPDEAEILSVEAFRALLTEWRDRIRQSERANDLPQTHRRNEAAPITGPIRGDVERRWHELIAGSCAREEAAAWARLWAWAPMKVESEVLVMSALQTLDGFDMTHDPAKPNLVRHGEHGPGRQYYHSDDHVRGELEGWLTSLDEHDEDPDGFFARIRARSGRTQIDD